MIRLTETATTSLSRAMAFAHIGDFATIQEWDPGVVASAKSTMGPTGVGTIYDLELSYAGRKMHMQYRITEYEPERRVVLEGVGGMVKAIDTIEFESNGTGSKVIYTADLGLKGIARIVEPLMKGRFAAIGRSAGAGLRQQLAELEVDAR